MNSTWYEPSTGIQILFSILDAVAAVSNLAVMALIIQKTYLRTVSNLLVCELALADFLLAALVVPFSIISYREQTWLYDHGLCVFQGYLFNMLYIISASLASVISIDRYYLLASPMSHTANISTTHLLWVTGFVVVHSAFWANFPLYDIEHLKYFFLPRQARCGIKWTVTGVVGSYLFFVLMVSFAIPTFALIVMYRKSIQAALESARKIRPGNVQIQTFCDGNFTTVAKAENVGSMKGILTVSVIIGSFLISRAPMVVCNVGSWYSGDDFCSSSVELGFAWLQYFSALTNPYVYTILNRRLRTELKDAIKSCFGFREDEVEPKDLLDYLRNLTNENQQSSLPVQRSSAGASHFSTEIETLQFNQEEKKQKTENEKEQSKAS